MDPPSSSLKELAERIAQIQLSCYDPPLFNFPSVFDQYHERKSSHETFQSWDKDFQLNEDELINQRKYNMNQIIKLTHDEVPDEDVQIENNFDMNELINEFKPKRPPKSYICNICYETGHYIQFCPKAPDTTLTPYQGSKRCFGEFVCGKCKRRWKSSKSFAEIGQECKKCKITVFPKKQYALTSRQANNETFDSMSTSMSSSCCSFNSC